MREKYAFEKIFVIPVAFLISAVVIFCAAYGICGRLGEQKLKLATTNPEATSSLSPEMQMILFGLVIVAVCGIIALAAWWLTVRKCPKCRCRQMRRIKKEVLRKADFYDDGIIESTYRCKRCGHEWKERKTYSKYAQRYDPGIPVGGDYSGGGGFSGGGGSFGGGSTAGGGAGGHW